MRKERQKAGDDERKANSSPSTTDHQKKVGPNDGSHLQQGRAFQIGEGQSSTSLSVRGKKKKKRRHLVHR